MKHDNSHECTLAFALDKIEMLGGPGTALMWAGPRRAIYRRFGRKRVSVVREVKVAESSDRIVRAGYPVARREERVGKC
jgi:hypothetical protein